MQCSFRSIYLFIHILFSFIYAATKASSHSAPNSDAFNQSVSQSVNSLIHAAIASVTTSFSYFPRFSFSHYVDKSRYARRIRNELFTFPRVARRCNALRNYASCRGRDCNILTTFSFQHPTSFLAARDLKVEC